MKNYIVGFILLSISSCIKNDTNTNTISMTPCSIINKGIFVSRDFGVNSVNTKISTFKIDSVVFKSNIFSLWITENITNEKLLATLRRYDNSNFQTGKYYFIDSSNFNSPPSYNSMVYPVVFFEVKSLNTLNNAYYLYDLHEVCVSVENGKFGILIEDMKVADTRSGNPSVALTFSLENTQITNR